MLKKLLLLILLTQSWCSFSQTITSVDSVSIKRTHALFAASELIELEYCEKENERLNREVGKWMALDEKNKEDISNIEGQMEVKDSRIAGFQQTIANDNSIIKKYETKVKDLKFGSWIWKGLVVAAFVFGLAL